MVTEARKEFLESSTEHGSGGASRPLTVRTNTATSNAVYFDAKDDIGFF